MAPDALDVYRSGFLTLQSATLGRLVTDVQNPGDDFWPNTADTDRPVHDVELRPFASLREAKSASVTGGFGAKLSRLLKGEVAHGSSDSDVLKTDQLVRYHLLQHRDYFTKLCKSEDARQWMEKAMVDYPLFLVVGLITVDDARSHTERQKHWQGLCEGEAPVGELLGIPDPTGTLSFGLKMHFDGSSGRTVSFTASGERVIGVRYRKLKFKPFKKKSIDAAWLEDHPNRWETFTGGDRAGEENVIEADLEDELEEGDLECDVDEDDDMIVFDADISEDSNV
ncbi:hypothetical protein DRE_02660 [Drechslerella stenobrocha 248]|uniref:Uncharacterized protein n=1 Tax=Drechslerella stenobrocha 248 TaxID=1043628 RepID=W7HV67_9PEZI|nr:hypothetical protein DRE_02660 [Drechslerella stenobrocha 248]